SGIAVTVRPATISFARATLPAAAPSGASLTVIDSVESPATGTTAPTFFSSWTKINNRVFPASKPLRVKSAEPRTAGGRPAVSPAALTPDSGSPSGPTTLPPRPLAGSTSRVAVNDPGLDASTSTGIIA